MAWPRLQGVLQSFQLVLEKLRNTKISSTCRVLVSHSGSRLCPSSLLITSFEASPTRQDKCILSGLHLCVMMEDGGQTWIF
uniref:LD43581p n=1 Tax=Drosophila melanogaster TaxID=7227 RepID=Q86MR0_DROME|nr:LD43581p [Drosophila melanogaster]